MYKTATRRHARNDFDKIQSIIKNAALDAKNQAGDMVSDSFKEIKSQTRNARKKVKGYVTHKPFKTIGTALLIGALVGYFLHK